MTKLSFLTNHSARSSSVRSASLANPSKSCSRGRTLVVGRFVAAPQPGADLRSPLVYGPETEDAFLRVLGELLKRAQKARTLRADLTVPDVKAILVGCLAIQAASPDAAERLTEVVLDGLRAR